MVKEKRNKFLFTSLLFLIAFIVILINFNLLSSIDSSASNVSLHNVFLTSVFTFFHYAFDTITVVIYLLLFAVYLWIKKYKKESVFVAILGIMTGLVVLILKNVVERVRPLNQLVSETGFAFPSGHATSAVVLFGLICYFVFRHFKSKIVKTSVFCVSVFMIVLIGFSRVYLNVHWFSDVLAGYCLGAFLLFLGIYLFERF